MTADTATPVAATPVAGTPVAGAPVAGASGAAALDAAALADGPRIRAALEEAAETLRRLPAGLRRPRLTSWPEVVRDSAGLLGPSAEGRGRPAAPTPGAIDRMDRVLTWLLACDAEARRLVWARACRVPWRRLEDLDGRSHVTLRKVVARGHGQIRRYLARS